MHGGRDSNPHLTVLETGILAIGRPPYVLLRTTKLRRPGTTWFPGLRESNYCERIQRPGGCVPRSGWRFDSTQATIGRRNGATKVFPRLLYHSERLEVIADGFLEESQGGYESYLRRVKKVSDYFLAPMPRPLVWVF